ncbi:minor capsid protein [Streptomyces sp. NPDC059853]|uniref:minor capsid protein n=1 Tax=Streptomyces sp. NPDC059853 TaxID=3346973 RepID=UPI00365FC54E
MTYTSDLLDGVARLLDAEGVGTYRPDGIYAAVDTAIVIADMPPDPDRVICLSAYPVEDSPALTDTVTGVQVRTRASTDPRAVVDLDDQALDVLGGSGPHAWGAARVQLIYRQSAADIGADQLGRRERASNFYALAHRAGRHLE